MSALDDLRDAWQLLIGEMWRIVIARTPFVRDGKLDLSSQHIVGNVPPSRLPDSATTIRGATDYDDTTAPTTGQAVIWNGTKYHPATVGTSGAGSAWSVLTDGNSNVVFAAGDVVMIETVR